MSSMLDPINAIGLASSITQLIEFSVKLLKEASDIRSKGSSEDVLHLKKLTHDLIGLGAAVQKRPRPHELSDDKAIIREEEAFESLADDCMKVGDELVTVLTRLTSEHASGRWQSLRLALLTVWKKERIDKLANLLGGYRQELALRRLTILDAKNDIHASNLKERLDSLQQSNKEIKEIKEIVLATHDMLERALYGQTQVMRIQQSSMKQAGDEHKYIEHLLVNDYSPNDENVESRMAAAKRQKEPLAPRRHVLGEMGQAPGPKSTKRSRSDDDSSDDDGFFNGRPMKKLFIDGPEGASSTGF